MTKRKRKPAEPSDLGADENWKQGRVELDPTAAFARARARCKSVLDWYLNRGHITRRQREAGERLSSLWAVALSEPVVVASYGPRIDPTYEAIEQAMRRRDKAKRAVDHILDLMNPEDRLAVENVCRWNVFPARVRGVVFLRSGLDVAADWMSLTPDIDLKASGG